MCHSEASKESIILVKFVSKILRHGLRMTIKLVFEIDSRELNHKLYIILAEIQIFFNFSYFL